MIQFSRMKNFPVTEKEMLVSMLPAFLAGNLRSQKLLPQINND
jgi:hypothetical protein